MLHLSRRHRKAFLGAAAAVFALGSPGAVAGSDRSAVSAGTPPVCFDSKFAIEVRKDDYTPEYFDCSFSEADGDPVIRVTDRPDHGDLDVMVDGSRLYYTPDPGYVGPDSLKVVLYNAAGDSAEQTVDFDVIDGYNTAPGCVGDTVTGEIKDPPDAAPHGHANARKGRVRAGSGTCRDFHYDDMTFEVVQPPTSGTLTTGTDAEGQPTYSYTPDPGVADGTKVGAVIRAKDEFGLAGPDIPIGFIVRATNFNSAPFCPHVNQVEAHRQTFENGEPANVRGTFCTDNDGDPVTLDVVSAPAGTTTAIVDGRIQLTASVSTGSGTVAHRGTDTPPAGITPLRATSDGSAMIKFAPAHTAPSCSVSPLATTVGTRTEFEIPCADPDGDAVEIITYAHGGGPRRRWAGHGDLEIRNVKDGKLRFTYIPDGGFTGTDTFEFSLYDAFDEGAKNLVSIAVNAPPAGGGGGTPTPPSTPGGSPPPPPAAFTPDVVAFLKRIAGLNRKGLDPRKPVVNLGELGPAQLPNGGTARFDVYDKAQKKLLGTVKVTLLKGQSKKVRAKLDGKGKALLSKKRKVKLTVRAALIDALTGAQVKQAKSYTFKVRKKKRR